MRLFSFLGVYRIEPAVLASLLPEIKSVCAVFRPNCASGNFKKENIKDNQTPIIPGNIREYTPSSPHHQTIQLLQTYKWLFGTSVHIGTSWLVKIVDLAGRFLQQGLKWNTRSVKIASEPEHFFIIFQVIFVFSVILLHFHTFLLFVCTYCLL